MKTNFKPYKQYNSTYQVKISFSFGLGNLQSSAKHLWKNIFWIKNYSFPFHINQTLVMDYQFAVP